MVHGPYHLEDLFGTLCADGFPTLEDAWRAAWGHNGKPVAVVGPEGVEGIVITAITYRSSLGEGEISDEEVESYIAALGRRLDNDEDCTSYILEKDHDGDVIERVAWVPTMGGEGLQRLQYHGERAYTEC